MNPAIFQNFMYGKLFHAGETCYHYKDIDDVIICRHAPCYLTRFPTIGSVASVVVMLVLFPADPPIMAYTCHKRTMQTT